MKVSFNKTALTILRDKLAEERDRLAVFDKSPEGGQGMIGSKIRSWAKSVIQYSPHSDHLDRLPDERITREWLASYCQKRSNESEFSHSTLHCGLSIAAWGSMRRSHGRNFFAKFNDDDSSLRDALEQLRTSSVSRYDDFILLQELHNARHMPGVGIAYYTKFLFFLRPVQDAYILDQWTAKSVNILLEEPLIDMSSSGYVMPHNTPEKYEEFCRVIDDLKLELGVTSGAQAEQKIFSQGGRQPYPWRAYVKNYPLQKSELTL